MSHRLTTHLLFRVCLDLIPLSQPAPKQCFNPKFKHQPLHQNAFRENQLAPNSIGIPTLTTTRPLMFQHQSIWTSTQCYLSLTLAMLRSFGFGSIYSDNCSIETRFLCGSNIFRLNLTLHISCRLMHTVKRLVILLLLIDLQFHVLFNSPPGVLFTLTFFLAGYDLFCCSSSSCISS